MPAMNLDIMVRVQNKALGAIGKDLDAINAKGKQATGNLTTGMDGVGRSAKRAGGLMTKVTRVLDVFLLYKGFVFLQTQLTNFIGEIINLEHELAIVQTQLNDLGQDFRPQIQTEIFDIGGRTGMAFSALAKAEFEIVSANIAVADSYEILDLSAKAAVAGGLQEVETAFNAALTQINAFGLSVEDFNEVFDKQFALVKRGIFTYEQLSGVIGNTSVVFAAMGQDIDTSNAALAAISQIFTGKQLEQGATGLANAVRRMTFQFEEFGEQGLDIVDPLTGEFRNLVDIIEDLDAALDGLTESERAARIKQLFPDIRQQRGIAALLTQAPEFRQFTVEQKFSTGDLEEAFGTVEDSLKIQARQLRNDIIPHLNTLGDVLGDIIKVFRKVGEEVGEAFDGFNNFLAQAGENVGSIFGAEAGRRGRGFVETTGLNPLDNLLGMFGDLIDGKGFKEAVEENFLGITSGSKPEGVSSLIDLAQEELKESQRRTDLARMLPGALREQQIFDLTGGARGGQLEDALSGVDLTLAKIIEEAIFSGFEGDIGDALKTFAEEGADAFLVALGLLSPEGGTGSLIGAFPESIGFSETLMQASAAIREGLIDPMGFTADSLEMMGESAREFNRLLKVKGIIEQLEQIGDFFGFKDLDKRAVLAEVFNDLQGMEGSFKEFFEDPRKLADLLTSLEFGDINVDQSTQNNFVVRITGDADPSQAAGFADRFIEEVNRKSREATSA